MVLESPGSCCEAMINGLDSPGGCCEAICTLLHMKYEWFWNLQEAAANPLLIVWNLQAAVVKPFAHFSYEISMVL